MSTCKELVYMVLDELKLNTNDSYYQEEHVLYLLDKYRAFLLKQRYSDIRKEIPDSNYQTLCLDTEVEDTSTNNCANVRYLKTTDKVPNVMQIGKHSIDTKYMFQGNFTYINNERFKFVGYNKYLHNQTYGTIAPDNYLYMKSNNPQLYYLKNIRFTAIFESALEAFKLEGKCTNECTELMDKTFPIEESLVNPLIECVIKELSPHEYSPEDKENNDSDDLGKLANYIARHLKERQG